MQQKVGKTYDPSSGSVKTCDHSGQRLFVSVLPAGRDIPLSNDQLVGEEKGKEIIWMVKVAAGLHS
jgi:hypothetical protein